MGNIPKQTANQKKPHHLPLLVTLAAACWLLLPGLARAETLFGVVSERSAALVLQSAQPLLSAHRLVLRTPEQIATLTDREVCALWGEAHGLLFANVFGEQALRLLRLLRACRPAEQVPVLAISGDPELTLASRLAGQSVFEGLSPDAIRELTSALSSSDPGAKSWQALRISYPRQAGWIEGSAYWCGRAPENVRALLGWLLKQAGAELTVPEPIVPPAVRYLVSGVEAGGSAREQLTERKLGQLGFAPGQPVVALLDYEEADGHATRALHQILCAQLQRQGLGCLSVLSRWGHATATALEALAHGLGAARLSGLLVLQDFVLGGGEERARASRALSRLDVPVCKGIRLVDRSEAAWRSSSDGLPWDSVHYRLAMPELQGIGQPTVIEAAGPRRLDAQTGLALQTSVPLEAEIELLARKFGRWQVLQARPRREKRVALIYYNHPPGRHNIGADNLDVPASLWEILHALKAAGYALGELPKSPEALLERLQRDGVNLPEDRGALSAMAARVPTLGTQEYARFFQGLPEGARLSVKDGPLGRLRNDVLLAHGAGELELARARIETTLEDVEHVLEGSGHRARERARGLLAQLKAAYAALCAGEPGAQESTRVLTESLIATGIEGLRGWGAPPGRGMVHEGRLVLPGIQYGNVFLGPQPPRGWELDEELLHANLSFAPPHQYLAYYHWLRDVFRADVVIHVGRHSTYEFLPGPSVGLSRDDFPSLIVADLPSVYLYIVDGVGEGLAAKRRGGAVIVDHLTPPLSVTPLYDELLALRQLVESFEAMGSASGADTARARAVAAMREKIKQLKLEDALRANMDAELKTRGVSFNEVSDELLVHEVGHYLTELQESFMPFGLHVFGRAWKPQAVAQMLASLDAVGAQQQKLARDLTVSPQRERAALLHALDGGFVEPGHGNDPIRRPEVLPTGKNFHALDGGLLPTKLAYDLGSELARSARAKNPGTPEGSESVVLWASDTVRDEGVMVAFGLDMLGVRPLWNSRGILRSLERVALADGRVRRDVSFVTSGLFRDLYENLLVWLDRAVLLSLDGASETLRAAHPELVPALEAALLPLGELRAAGKESLIENQLAAHWLQTTQHLVKSGRPLAAAGREASVRLFGNAPGGYGAGVNALVERSGAWQDRSEVGAAFALRMGHAYGAGLRGAPMRAGFEQVLARTERSFLGRSSHLYGLLDNNDSFDYLGGLRMAVEERRGQAPLAEVVQYADPEHARVEPIERALFSELRGRHLNPAYLKALMQHGYAGARSLSFGFVENLWGWQVTSPDLIKPWVWDEVNAVYLQDAHQIGLSKLLEQGESVHVKANIEAVLLVAAHKGFWSPDEATLRALAQDFARIVSRHGLPGSGHTRPDHPVMGLVSQRLTPAQRSEFQRALERAQQPAAPAPSAPSAIAEVRPQAASEAEAAAARAAGDAGGLDSLWNRLGYGLLFASLAVFASGIVRGRR